MTTLAATLEAAISTFDLATLEWASEGFAASALVSPAGLKSLVAEIKKSKAKTLKEAFFECGAKGPFAVFALACLARHAGAGEDVVKKGAMSKLTGAIAGNLTVDGPLVCDSENWLLVAGDVTAHSLITSADVIIAGKASFRDGVLGLNSFTQSLWVRGPVEAKVFITSDYAAEASVDEIVDLSDDAAEKLLAAGVAEKVREWASDGGPDDAVRRLLKDVKAGKPVFR